MSTMPDDTDATTAERMTALYARMTPADKLRRVRDLTEMTARLALAGLRARHPEANTRELLLRLARIRLGDDAVDRAYPESKR